ncbi:MAG: hypothetical protein U0871_19490 [Gemmataceae bacterium]
MNPVAPRSAAAVCRLFALKPPAAALLRPDHTPQAFFDELVAAGHLADARRLLAHALSAHRAVWWAALCLNHSERQKPFDSDAERSALAAAVGWCLAPSEPARRGCAAAARAAGQTTPAGVLATAAFVSSGSLSKPGLPAVVAEPHVCGRLCGVAVYLASVRYDPARYKAHLREYLAIGREVARGTLLTPNPDPVLPATPAAPAGDPELAARLAAFKAQAEGSRA